MKSFHNLELKEYQESEFLYSGQAIRLDGHFKKAAMIRKWLAALKYHDVPYTALLAFCATDGSLLAPVIPVRGEAWVDIEQQLRPLLVRMITARLAAGLSFRESVPCFVATDSFGKHRLKLRRLLRDVTQQLRLQPLSATPRGPAAQLQCAAADQHPSDRLCTIAGEPYHKVIALRRLASAQCNDARATMNVKHR